MDDPLHILVVDDDDRIRDLLKRFLSAQRYLVTTAPNANTARRMMDQLSFDLAVLDIMMPGEDGLSLLEAIRTVSAIPVILLTARDLPADKIEGLKLGADDYVTKPFEPEELSLRIASILRRAGPREEYVYEPVHMSGLIFDPARGELRKGDDYVRLTEAERQLLRLLSRNLGQAVERHVLAAYSSSGFERSIDVQVTRLRKKIEPDPREPIHLQTVRGVGYRLLGD